MGGLYLSPTRAAPLPLLPTFQKLEGVCEVSSDPASNRIFSSSPLGRRSPGLPYFLDPVRSHNFLASDRPDDVLHIIIIMARVEAAVAAEAGSV